MVALDVSALTGGLNSALSGISGINLGDIATQLAMGAIVTTAASGLRSEGGQNALDPLHIFHKDGSQSVIGGKTITTAAFAALDATGKQAVLTAGYTITG